MNKEIKLAIWVASVALIAWFVAENAVKQAAPVQQPPRRNWKTSKPEGDRWQTPVVAAQWATGNLQEQVVV